MAYAPAHDEKVSCSKEINIQPQTIGLKLICNVNIVFGKLKSEKFQDYAQKPQRNGTFKNSASGQVLLLKALIFLAQSIPHFLTKCCGFITKIGISRFLLLSVEEGENS
jgi:hypothetical protein